MGITFTVSVYLQTVRDYNAIKTGVIFTALTLGILLASLAAERLAKRREQRTLIRAGFVVTIAGIGLLLALVKSSEHIAAFVPGLFLMGIGLGVMLTPSVNIVQSSFPEEKQGEISGVSRSISNLGSSFGTAIAGTILVSDLASGNRTYVLAMISLGALALVGLAAAMLLPANIAQETASPRVGSHVRRPVRRDRAAGRHRRCLDALPSRRAHSPPSPRQHVVLPQSASAARALLERPARPSRR